MRSRTCRPPAGRRVLRLHLFAVFVISRRFSKHYLHILGRTITVSRTARAEVSDHSNTNRDNAIAGNGARRVVIKALCTLLACLSFARQGICVAAPGLLEWPFIGPFMNNHLFARNGRPLT
jgi:hypothetical protein